MATFVHESKEELLSGPCRLTQDCLAVESEVRKATGFCTRNRECFRLQGHYLPLTRECVDGKDECSG